MYLLLIWAIKGIFHFDKFETRQVVHEGQRGARGRGAERCTRGGGKEVHEGGGAERCERGAREEHRRHIAKLS